MIVNYYKGEPNTYTVCFRNGKVKKHGAGINFFYMPLTTTIAAVPLASLESHFVFTETTADYQEIAIQGSFTYRLDDPLEVSSRLNFTVEPGKHRYKSQDPEGFYRNQVNVWGPQPYKGNVFFSDMNSGLWAVKLLPRSRPVS